MNTGTFGVDFVIDYYALFGVPRDADKSAITTAYHKKQMQYHPDRFQGLAPELLREAEHQSNLLNVAYAVLSDGERRAGYDNLLANWKRPLSRRGEIVIDLTDPHFSFASLVDHLNEDPDVREREAEKLALQFSGFEKATYEFFRSQAESPAGIPDALKPPYLEQLERRDLYLSLREGFLWDNLGDKNHSPTPKLEYRQQVGEHLIAVRELARTNVERQVFLLTAGEQALLPAPEGSGEIVDVGTVLAHYTARLDEHFERQKALLEPLAAEREDILGKRFEIAAELEYDKGTVEYTDKVLLGMLGDGTWVWVVMEFDANSVRVADPPEGVDALEDVNDRSAAERFVRDGYTVLRFKAVQGIEFLSQLNRVADLHAKKLQTSNKPTA